MRTVAYIRVSTDQQDLGPDAQRAAVVAWAERGGHEVVAWFEDRGLSGADGLEDRPGLAGALRALREVGATCLVAAKRDRIARDTLVALTVEASAQRAGAVVRTADGMSDMTGAAGKMARGMLDLFAAYERDVIAERTAAALAVKAARGERVGTCPFGWRVAGDGVRLEPEPGEQAVVEAVRRLRSEGVRVVDIVARLEEMGVRGRTGRPLGRTQVSRLVRGQA
jgi:DNA invertase Pin-like site-specific DNA recombinase